MKEFHPTEGATKQSAEKKATKKKLDRGPKEGEDRVVARIFKKKGN